MSWKTLLTRHDNLVAKGNCTLYDRVVLLRKVFEDPKFVEDSVRQGNRPTELLDVRLSDTCANFTELLQIVKLFPKKDQWKTGNLGEMRRKMLESIRSQQNGHSEPAKDPQKLKKTLESAIRGKVDTYHPNAKSVRITVNGEYLFNSEKSKTEFINGIRSDLQSMESVKDHSDRRLSWKEKFIDLEVKYKVLEGRYKQLERDHRELSASIGKRRVG